MAFILITKWLDKTFTENLYEKHYKKNVRACILKKTFIIGDYSVYAVARVPETGEDKIPHWNEIIKDHGVEIMENDKLKIEQLRGKE